MNSAPWFRRSPRLTLACLFATGWGVLAQPAVPGNSAAAPAPPPAAPASRSAAELEKLAAPIALHPDPLVALILPASVYPLEIVQAARFVKNTNNLAQLDQQPWDANVKAVAKFPDLIARMDADLTWTVALGKAFLDQPKELMDTIQALRAKAQKAGTLRTTEQQVVTVTNVIVLQTNITQVVTVTNQVVQVQPANPQVVYVPTYTPSVYYPPPTYVYDPYAPLVTFGVGMAVGAIIANNCDWHGGCVWVGGGGAVWVGGGGDVDIDIDEINIDRGNRAEQRSGDRSTRQGATATQQRWQPDQGRLQNAGAPSTQNLAARGWGSGTGTRPTTQPAAGQGMARPATQPGALRPTQPVAQPAQRPIQPAPQMNRPPIAPQQPMARPATRPTMPQGTAARPAIPATAARPMPSQPTAFTGVNNGYNARNYSNRGAASRGTVSRGGGMRGGGGGRR